MEGPKHASGLISKRGVITWDLVALGDSTPTGYGLGSDQSYVQVYASHLQKDLNVVVEVHNWATNEARTVSEWVKEVQNNEELRKDLRNAEVITIWLGCHNVIPHIFREKEDSSYDLAAEIDTDCLQKVTSPMQRHLIGFYQRLRFLRPPMKH